MASQVLIEELFSRTESAMLLADDDRRYLDANPPACELLGLTREEILEKKVEDLSPPELRDQVPAIYQAFIEAGSQSGPYTLVRPDGIEIPCSYSASANVLPGVHLSILIPVEKADPELDVHEEEPHDSDLARLTDREREVLTMLALGENNATIAKKLHLSQETVRSHTRSARLRLGARSRSHAIALALASGQLDLDAGCGRTPPGPGRPLLATTDRSRRLWTDPSAATRSRPGESAVQLRSKVSGPHVDGAVGPSRAGSGSGVRSEASPGARFGAPGPVSSTKKAAESPPTNKQPPTLQHPRHERNTCDTPSTESGYPFVLQVTQVHRKRCGASGTDLSESRPRSKRGVHQESKGLEVTGSFFTGFEQEARFGFTEWNRFRGVRTHGSVCPPEFFSRETSFG